MTGASPDADWPDADRAALGTRSFAGSSPAERRPITTADWLARFAGNGPDLTGLVRTSWPYAPHVGAVPRIGRGL